MVENKKGCFCFLKQGVVVVVVVVVVLVVVMIITFISQMRQYNRNNLL